MGDYSDELLALSSIYEDELHLDDDNRSGSLTLAVSTTSPVTIVSSGREDLIRFLPPVKFTFFTSEGYPQSSPPLITLECPWLMSTQLESLESDIKALWNEEPCLFSMIDELCERAKGAFGLSFLSLSEDTFESIRSYSEGEQLRQFNSSVHFCEICQERKKGVECFMLRRCGHVSCKVTCFKTFSL
jgi:hypothetical protein